MFSTITTAPSTTVPKSIAPQRKKVGWNVPQIPGK
jgi:hypothetical protein